MATGPQAVSDPSLLLVAANAAFRNSAPQVGDRKAAVERLDGVIQAYADVLRKDPNNADAAYNYEFVSQMRDTLAKAPATGSRQRQESAAKPRTGQRRSAGRPDGPRPAGRAARGYRHERLQDDHADALRRARGADGSGPRQGDSGARGKTRAGQHRFHADHVRGASLSLAAVDSARPCCVLWVWRLGRRRIDIRRAGADADAAVQRALRDRSAICPSGSA